LDFIYQIIDSFHHAPSKGLPLGNVTSQLFANIYMNELDQFIKHKLKVKYYIRYCDDFVILNADRAVLEKSIEAIRKFLSKELLLYLHPRKVEIRKLRQGTDFLGYVSLPHYRVLRTKTKKRMFRKIRDAKKRLDARLISDSQFKQILASYMGMLSHCRGREIERRLSACYSQAMSTLILDGRAVRDAAIPALTARIKGLLHKPVLAIIQVGDRPDSTAFIKAKSSFAEKVGAKTKHVHLPESALQAEVIKAVQECNADPKIHGIIVQLPLPLEIDQEAVIDAIDPHKDADALTSSSVKRWLEGREDALLPATTRGVKELLEYYKIELFNKHVVVVGRSMLVGKPLAAFVLNENATVTVCHSKTLDLTDETKKADVLIVAAGRPELIGAGHVREGTVVIDVGINTAKSEKLEDELPGKKLVGDVDFEVVKSLASAITPVPGGVGPMTVLGLFENLADLCS